MFPRSKTKFTDNLINKMSTRVFYIHQDVVLQFFDIIKLFCLMLCTWKLLRKITAQSVSSSARRERYLMQKIEARR